jgi:hypothetical protein
MIAQLIKNWRGLRAVTGRGVFDCAVGAWHMYGMQKAYGDFVSKQVFDNEDT